MRRKVVMLLGEAGRRAHGRAAAFAVVALLSGRTDAQALNPSRSPPDTGPTAAPSPTPEPTPAPSPKRLRLDIDRVMEELEQQGKGVPRFETQVEVIGKSPQVMLDRFLEGIEYDCSPGGAPPGGGAPTHVEMRAARWNPSPAADLTGLLKLLAGALKSRGEDKYFLLREGRLPDAFSYAAPGTTFELVKGFADAKGGANGLRRLERGFATPEGPSAPPPAPWQTSTCRPR